MDVESQLIQGIHDRELATVVARLQAGMNHDISATDRDLLTAAASACSAIRAVLLKERASASRSLDAAAIPHSFDERELESPQIHQFSVEIAEADVGAAIEQLALAGYEAPALWTPVQLEILKRTRNSVVLTRIDEVTTRARLQWPRVIPTGKARKFWPRIEDGKVLRLPAGFWWLGFAARPITVALRRAGLLRESGSVGEFLGTPEELVPTLLDFAEVSSSDTVCDLGCGDGRILVEAAGSRSCKAIGYEFDESLCDVARDRAREQGVSDLVRIHADDVSHANLDEVSVVFLFLPPATVAGLLPSLLAKLPRGARVIAHEQSPLNVGIVPDKSSPLFASSAMTVAHAWIVT